MHSKSILGTVVAVLIFLNPTYIFGQKTKGKMGLSVKQEVDLLFTDLKKNLGGKTTTKKKFELLSGFQTHMTEIRNKNARQLESEEISMDLLISGLGQIPTEQEFKKTECTSYRDKITRALSPSIDQGEPMDPSTKSALDVLSLICK